MKKKISSFGFAFVFPLAATLLFGIGCSDDDDDDGDLNGPSNGSVTITRAVENNNNLTILEVAIDTANLDNTLEAAGPYTLFAPSDSAFNELDSAALSELLADSAGTLGKILRGHVVAGNLSSAQLATQDSVITLSGSVIRISVRNGTIYLNDSVRVTNVNLKASNGTIHIIDKVLVP